MITKIKSLPIFKWILGLLLGAMFLGGLLFTSVYAGLWGKVPTKTDILAIKQSQATEIFSSEGKLLGKYYFFDRQPITFQHLPEHLIQALIAIEDARFYEHSGIDKKSLLRVFFKTILLQDESAGGGSTISLQLAKNLFGREDHGIFSLPVNKFKEAITARRLEDIYTKNEIITLYFNTVPFSDNTYGIESAARKFFGTPASDLNLTQSTVLVGSLKANHYYNPRIYPERSQERRNVVLQQMEKYGYIDQETLQNSLKAPLKLNYRSFNHNQGVAPYFRAHLRGKVKNILDSIKNKNDQEYNIYSDGLKIYTTLDYQMQVLAQEIVKEHMAKLQEQFEQAYGQNPPWKQKRVLQEALKNTPQYQSLAQAGWNEEKILDSLNRKSDMELFAWEESTIKPTSVVDSLSHYLKFLNVGMININPNSGAVKSWIGGIDHEHFKYDHVAQSRRQVGSTFKPIVYSAALEAGIPPCTYYSIREVTYAEGWTPSNATNDEEDPFMNYTMEYALSRSINTIAVKVLFDAGLENVIRQARKMGITATLPKVPSLALGTAALKVKEMAGAYSSYVNQGIPTTPYFISKIEDKQGNIIFEHPEKEPSQPAFSETTRQIMLEMMQTTVDSGTAARLRYKYHLPNDIAGKTGTTQDNKDGWFVGITPNLVSVTWVGTDNYQIGFPNTALGQGANSALPIFAGLLQKMNANEDFNEITQARFAPPSNEVSEMMDCPPSERDNFLERLFGKRDQPQRPNQNKEKTEKKEGFFSKVLGIFGGGNNED